MTFWDVHTYISNGFIMIILVLGKTLLFHSRFSDVCSVIKGFSQPAVAFPMFVPTAFILEKILQVLYTQRKCSGALSVRKH